MRKLFGNYSDKMENIIIENLLALKDEAPLKLMAQFDMEAIAKSIIAFANAQGGSIILGIDDDKKIVGVNVSENAIKNIHEHLCANIQPTAPVSLNVINYMKTNIIFVNTWMGAHKPYQYISKKDAIEGAVKGAVQRALEGASEGTIEGTKNKLIQILLAIHQKPGMRNPEIEGATGIPVKTLERYVKRLKEANLIEFKGSSFQTGGYYSTIKI